MALSGGRVEYWVDFNDEWDYGDPVGTEGRFRELLQSGGGDAQYRLQLLTQIARTLGLQERFEEAQRLLDEVAEEMEPGGVVQVRYLLEQGRVYGKSGQLERSVPLFLEAAALAEQIGADYYAVDALHMMGIVVPPGERLEWNEKAIAYAEKAGDPWARNWLGSLYNNVGWTLFDQERYEEALAAFEQALAQREAQGDEAEIAIAQWCVARVLRALGRVEEALAIQRELEALPEPDGFNFEEIAEGLLALGRVEESKPYFRMAHQLLSEIGWVAQDEERMARLARLGGV